MAKNEFFGTIALWKGGKNNAFYFYFSKCRLHKENIYLLEPFLPDIKITFTCNHLADAFLQNDLPKCQMLVKITVETVLLQSIK